MKFKKDATDQEVMLGAGLLSDISKSQVVSSNATVYIDIDKIVPNQMNEYSIDDIESFAELIYLSGGIKQDLILKPMNADGTYTLTTGERRWRAAKLLIQQGKWPQDLQGKVPCKIENPSKIELPLDEEQKEKFSIMVTNKYRDKSDGDKLMEIREWKNIFDTLRKNGVKVLSASGEDGKEAVQKIKGVPTRQLVSQQVGVSTGQVSRYEDVDKKGSEALIEGLLKNQLNLSTAEKVVELPKEEQTRFMEKHKEKSKITSEDVVKHKEKEEKRVSVTVEVFDGDIQGIRKRVEEGAITLSDAEYKNYQKCLIQLSKILCK